MHPFLPAPFGFGCNVQGDADKWARTGDLTSFPATPVAAAFRSCHGPRAALVELKRVELPLHLFIFTYAFLLRLSSKALPKVLGYAGYQSASNCTVHLEDDALVVVMERRKDKANGNNFRNKC